MVTRTDQAHRPEPSPVAPADVIGVAAEDPLHRMGNHPHDLDVLQGAHGGRLR